MNWAYIAGFFDGEGCVSRLNKNASHIYWRIDIVQKDRNVLDEIQKFIRYGKVFRSTTGIKKTLIYRYGIHKQEQILDFLSNVLPYVVVKKEKVQKLLENPWKRQPPWNKGEKHPCWGKHHTEETKEKMRISRRKYLCSIKK